MEQIYRGKLLFEKLYNPALLEAAKNLKMQGVLVQDDDFAYLKIDDSFIHDLFPLIPDCETWQKLDYFSDKDSYGAHITLIYPDDDVVLKNNDINTLHSFEISELIKTRVDVREYYVLMISSPSLAFLRKKYNLPQILNFKGYNIGLHITLATRKFK